MLTMLPSLVFLAVLPLFRCTEIITNTDFENPNKCKDDQYGGGNITISYLQRAEIVQLFEKTLRGGELISNNGCVNKGKNGTGSECCTDLEIIPHHKNRLCVNITYVGVNQTAIDVFLTWNGQVEIHAELIDFNECICLKLPIWKIGNLVEVCVYFTKMSRENGTLSGCVNLFFKFIIPSASVQLGCFGNTRSAAFSAQLSTTQILLALMLPLLNLLVFNDFRFGYWNL